MSMGDLALVYSHQKRYADAEKLFEGDARDQAETARSGTPVDAGHDGKSG